MDRNWCFAFRGEGTDTLELDIYDSIGEWFGGVSARSVRARLRESQDAKTIKLRINSMGGEVLDGLAIYSQLIDHPARVEAQVDGIAASMASVVLMAADEIRIAPEAYVMIHNPWAMTMGESDDMRRMADLLDKHQGAIIDIYAKKTGAKKDDLRKWMNEESWMTADEAKERGFVDTISKPKQKSKAKAAAFAMVLPDDYRNMPESLRSAAASYQQQRALSERAVPEPQQQTPPPEGSAETKPEPFEERDPAMAEKKEKETSPAPVVETTATPSIARALGLPAGSPESEILAAAARCRELEVQITTMTDSKTSNEALGAVRELVKTAGRVVELEARLAKVEGERDEQDFETELANAKAEEKITPAEEKLEREAFQNAKSEGRAQQHVEFLRGRMKVARANRKPPRHTEPTRSSSSSAVHMEWNGLKYGEMSYAQRARLSKEDPELYRDMKSDHDERRKSA